MVFFTAVPQVWGQYSEIQRGKKIPPYHSRPAKGIRSIPRKWQMSLLIRVICHCIYRSIRPNIFNTMNVLGTEKRISLFLKAISPPQRLKIIVAIGADEVCVCHLEAIFPQWRQAYISQHLMALREADVLNSRRDGRYIFYRLTNPGILGVDRDGSSHRRFDRVKPAIHCCSEL